MPENATTQTPAAGGDTQTGADQTAAAGQGAGTGAEKEGISAPSTDTLDVNALRAQLEAELRPAIEADVKRKLAAEIKAANERAKAGQRAEEIAAERDALAARVQELETQLSELKAGQERAQKQGALQAALQDLVQPAVVHLLVREYADRVAVRDGAVIPLTADGKPFLTVKNGKAAPIELRDWLRTELQSSYPDLLKPQVAAGSGSAPGETPGAQRLSAAELFNRALRGQL